MACYAEVIYREENETMQKYLIRLENKEERDYVMWRFIDTALPCERIRALTVKEARKCYDLSRFGRLPYERVFMMANPDRPGRNWIFDAIESNEDWRKRHDGWNDGRGQGTLWTLNMEGE